MSLGVYDFNPRARRVYEKCGFRLEGRLRHALLWEGQWHDELLMAILSSDPGRLTDPVPLRIRDRIGGRREAWGSSDQSISSLCFAQALT